MQVLVTSAVPIHAIQMMNRETVVLLLSSLAACEAPPSSSLDASTVAEPSSLTIIPPTSDSEFYQAIVSAEGGQLRVEIEPITLDQIRSENALRATGKTSTQSIVRDSRCSYSSFWLYDQPDGLGNRICFFDDGGYLLAIENVPRRWRCFNGTCEPFAFWDLIYGSYWSGVDLGQLSDYQLATETYGTFVLNFPSYGPLTNFDVTPSRVRTLLLLNPPGGGQP